MRLNTSVEDCLANSANKAQKDTYAVEDHQLAALKTERDQMET